MNAPARASLLASLALAAAAASPGASLAIDPAAGTGGAAFMRLGMGSARAMALGRSFVAAAEGTDALIWNPAGLGLTQQREMGYSYLRYIQDVDAPLYMAYAHPLGRTVWGANLAYMSLEGFDARDSQGLPLSDQDIRVQNGFATLSMARSFWYEKVFLGLSVKGVHEDNDGSRRDTMVGDFGVILKPGNNVSFGFATQNFGASQSQVGRVTRIGAAGRVVELLQLSLEVAKPSDNNSKVGLGAEFTLPEDFLEVGQVTLRAGFQSVDQHGAVSVEERHFLHPLVGAEGLTFGIGIYSSQAFGYGISFDYAMVSMGTLGTVDQLSLKMRF